MPKLGMEPVRRTALMQATVAEIGAAGSLDVTVSAIAKRAGMSSALAHHYYGGKEQIFLSAMRHILRDYSAHVRAALAATPRAEDQLDALIHANFAPSFFDAATVSAWLNFYVMAQSVPEAARLLRVYHRRLHTHLSVALRPHTAQPAQTARTLGALIDGVYLRAALGAVPFDCAATEVTRAQNALLKEPT